MIEIVNLLWPSVDRQLNEYLLPRRIPSINTFVCKSAICSVLSDGHDCPGGIYLLHLPFTWMPLDDPPELFEDIPTSDNVWRRQNMDPLMPNIIHFPFFIFLNKNKNKLIIAAFVSPTWINICIPERFLQWVAYLQVATEGYKSEESLFCWCTQFKSLRIFFKLLFVL